ncbi:glycosyltransferase family 52 [Streptococcus sp. FSL R7-0212]|uniref:glycosyltransferase family 52 n=1 Tax=Streptococcus sp. FSL R7-0212 TaxID=2921726 RepID=UPI0030F56D02
MNLIICHTPLQMYIAKKIIENHKMEQFHLINYFFSDNTKRKYYFKLLSQSCQISEEIQLHDSKGLVKETIRQRFLRNRIRYEKVFIASIDSIFVQSILTSIVFNELMTFDDGVANLFKNSLLYENQTPRPLKLLKKVLFISYDLESIKKFSKVHYTIYSGNNIISNCQKLTLFDYKIDTKINPDKEISILIGQPIYKDGSKNKNTFEQIAKNLKIEYYYPHPRETYIVNGINYINTDLIFEDYLSSILGKYSKIKLYTIFSSAVLGYDNLKNIEVKMLPMKEFEKEQELLHSFNIEFLESFK